MSETNHTEAQVTKPSIEADGCVIDVQIHHHNVSVCADIGSIAGCNSRYTAGLSRHIAKTGKKIEELTVGELLELHISHGEWFNNLSA